MLTALADKLKLRPAPGTKVLFTTRDILSIVWPLILEQALSLTIGVADTIMVTSVSSSALAGVSLVDSINVVLVQLFSALTTGGAVVCSQYIGRQDPVKARDSGRQLYVLCTGIALTVAALASALRTPLLRLIYGSIEADVMSNAEIYFTITALSYPFLALYNSGSALFRSMGRTRVTLVMSVLMNVINVGGNAITIFGLGMGAAGAATATLISRIVGGLTITLLLRNEKLVLHMRNYSLRLDMDTVKRILRIGVPSGFENSMFSLGKLLVASIVSSLGTAAIASNAVGHNLAMMQTIAGNSISMAIVTVVGRAMGAGQRDEARRYTRIFLIMVYVCSWVICLNMVAFAEPIVRMFGLAEESVADAVWITKIHGTWSLFTWPLSFVLPNTLRAAGDVRYTMLVSVSSMWLMRVLFSYVLAALGFGLASVWIAMITDWAVRAAFFCWRYRGDKWMEKKVV